MDDVGSALSSNAISVSLWCAMRIALQAAGSTFRYWGKNLFPNLLHISQLLSRSDCTVRRLKFGYYRFLVYHALLFRVRRLADADFAGKCVSGRLHRFTVLGTSRLRSLLCVCAVDSPPMRLLWHCVVQGYLWFMHLFRRVFA